MDQVKIRAAVAAHGLRKGQEATVAETPAIAGAIDSGVFVELDRIPGDEQPESLLGTYNEADESAASFEPDEPVDTSDPDDETPVPPTENVELPDPGQSTDDGETAATEYETPDEPEQETRKRRG